MKLLCALSRMPNTTLTFTGQLGIGHDICTNIDTSAEFCKVCSEQVDWLVLALPLHVLRSSRANSVQFTVIGQLMNSKHRQLLKHSCPETQKPRQNHNSVCLLNQQLVDNCSYQMKGWEHPQHTTATMAACIAKCIHECCNNIWQQHQHKACQRCSDI